MATINESVQVNVPVRTAYNQWTQFEDFPDIMEGVQEVRQIGDRHVHWHAKVWGKDLEWDAEITRQIPDKLIEWRSVSGPDNGGFVEFRPLGAGQTEISVHIEYDPQGAAESVGSALGIAKNRVHHDLEHLKEFLEQRGVETGAWRGSIGGNGTGSANPL